MLEQPDFKKFMRSLQDDGVFAFCANSGKYQEYMATITTICLDDGTYAIRIMRTQKETGLTSVIEDNSSTSYLQAWKKLQQMGYVQKQ